MCSVTHSYVWHTASYGTLLPRRRTRIVRVIWLVHMCDMTHFYAWHASSISKIWFFSMCDMTHSMCDVTHFCVCGMTRWYFIHSYACHMALLPWRRMRIVSLVTHTNKLLSHVARMTRSWVASRLWLGSWVTSHTHTNNLPQCRTQIISHVWMSSWVMSHVRISSWVMSRTHTNNLPRCRTQIVRMTWLIRTCDMTHSYVWRDSFMCVTWLVHICDMTHSHVWDYSSMCVTYLIQANDKRHSCVWLIHTCDMTHACVWLDSFHTTLHIHMFAMRLQTALLPRLQTQIVCVTWLIQMHDMPHLFVWQ